MHRTFVRSWFQAALALGFVGAASPVRAEVAAPSHALELGVGIGHHQGLDLARVQVGVDYRLAENFSVAPTVGVSLTEFLSQEPAGANG